MLYQDPPMTYSIYNYTHIYIYIYIYITTRCACFMIPGSPMENPRFWQPQWTRAAIRGFSNGHARPVCSWRGLANNGGGFPGDCIDDWCDWCHLVATARNSATARQCLTWRSLPQAVSIACVACPCRKEQYPAADLGCALRGHMLQSGNWPYSCLIGHWLSHKLKMDISGIVTGCRMLYTGCWFQCMYVCIYIYTSYIIYTCHIIISYIVI